LAMSASFEEQLRALRQDVAKILERLEGPPKAMSYERAAQMLGVSARKVFDLVAEGRLVPVRIGGRKKIPLSEIERLTTPEKGAKAQARVAARRKPLLRTFDAQAELAKLRKRR
jgi:excisionase family DNA binding protein